MPGYSKDGAGSSCIGWVVRIDSGTRTLLMRSPEEARGWPWLFRLSFGPSLDRAQVRGRRSRGAPKDCHPGSFDGLAGKVRGGQSLELIIRKWADSVKEERAETHTGFAA